MTQTTLSKSTIWFGGAVLFSVIGLRFYQFLQPTTTVSVMPTVTLQSDTTSIIGQSAAVTLPNYTNHTTLAYGNHQWWSGYQQDQDYYIQALDKQLQIHGDPVRLIQQLNQPKTIVQAPWLLTNGDNWYVIFERLGDGKRYYQVFIFNNDWHSEQQVILPALTTSSTAKTAAVVLGSAVIIAEDDGTGIVLANFSHLPGTQAVQQRFSKLYSLVDLYANNNGTVNIISQTDNLAMFTQVAVNNGGVQQRQQAKLQLPDSGLQLMNFARSGDYLLLLLRTNADDSDQYYLYPVTKNLNQGFVLTSLQINSEQPSLFATTHTAVLLDTQQLQRFDVKSASTAQSRD